jgi:hypothetical protein
MLIRLLNREMLRRDLQAAMDLKNDEHLQIAYLLPSLNTGRAIHQSLTARPDAILNAARIASRKNNP